MDAIPEKKISTSEKKSIFNDWSVSGNQLKIVLYKKIYTLKNVCCWKKAQGGSFYNISIVEHSSLTKSIIIFQYILYKNLVLHVYCEM
jgi:hypothetical protein